MDNYAFWWLSPHNLRTFVSCKNKDFIDAYQNIYLSLGSNMGNRYEYLQQAVDALFERVGGVVKISSVYESPALGFEGDAFLNCVVWIRSFLDPEAILTEALDIEKSLGRVRSAAEGYASRTIDIDVLFVEDLEYKSDRLQLPHPEIPNRRFVLLPMAELNARFPHPQSGEPVVKMLATTIDQSELTKTGKWLKNPQQQFDPSRFRYLAIEGNIGAGKTSLATSMSEDFNAKLILERFMDNPFLPKFYEEPERYAFPLEMSFMADRYQQLLEDITQYDLFKDYVVADYEPFKSMIFAQITLGEEEFALYKKLYHVMYKEVPKPDVYVYLYQNTDRLLENIEKRGRDFERNIEADYLAKINEGYLEFIKTLPPEKVRIIDISGMDFVANRADYLKILRELFA